MIKSQRGFGAVEAFLIVVIVGIIGGAGWYVMKASQSIDKTNSETANNSVTTPSKNSKPTDSSTTTNPVADETENWYLFTSKNSVYKIKLADGVNAVYTDEPYYSLIAFPFTPKEGTTATAKPQEGGKDGGVGLVINYFAKSSDATHEGTTQTGFKTTSGLEVQKFRYIQETEPQGLGLQKGDTEDEYFIIKGDSALQIRYSFAKGEVPHTDIVEKMVKSVAM